MKIGIVVACYNRPEYLKQTLECLRNTVYEHKTTVLFIDDGSGDETLHMDISIEMPKLTTVAFKKYENKGVADSLKIGLFSFYLDKCNVFVILDSDMIMKPDWLNKELALLEKFPERIITGFNANNSNRHIVLKKYKNYYHPVFGEYMNYYEKKSIGGANMMFNANNYDLVMKNLEYGNNWDHEVCREKINQGETFICTLPSVVQHIGIESSDTLKHKYFDTAKDYDME